MNGPTGLCIAPAGEIYVNDQGNKRVRQISTSGTITTVPGNGSAVHSGDGGEATAAGMVIPIRCAVDAGGNLLIVDQGAHRLRKVTTGGTISTYAGAGSQGFSGDGGAATSAAMNSPTAIAFDGSGNVYVTDQSNQRIRRIDTSGTIQTVAGNGSISFSGDGGSATAASLNYPGGIALDSSGALYIVDTVNQRIRKVSGGNISTIAGTGGTGFSDDGGAALQAQFNNPFPIALDASGNMYIGDTGNNRVRQISRASAKGAPMITAAGVTNAASFQTGIAPGGITTIFGTNLGATGGQIVTAPGAPWPNQVGGTTVTMDGVTAPVYRVLNLNGQELLSVQAPWSLSGKERSADDGVDVQRVGTGYRAGARCAAGNFPARWRVERRNARLRWQHRGRHKSRVERRDAGDLSHRPRPSAEHTGKRGGGVPDDSLADGDSAEGYDRRLRRCGGLRRPYPGLHRPIPNQRDRPDGKSVGHRGSLRFGQRRHQQYREDSD
ncbi:MAG: repeat containing protein [Candidatus Solibacter sp.]|nr:repeat containing protein [Candidatus Solibacter sp.]